MSELPVAEAAENDFYLMANLRPAHTGLPMVVWVSERGDAQHDVRVKVCREHGDRMQYNNTASVAVRPEPRLVAGQLAPADLAAVSRWITLNSDAIVAYWDGKIDTFDLPALLRPLPSPRPRAGRVATLRIKRAPRAPRPRR